MREAAEVWDLPEKERSRTAKQEAEKYRKQNLCVQTLADYWEASLGGPIEEALVGAPPEENKTLPYGQLPTTSSPTAPPGGTTEYNPTESPMAPPGGTTEYNPTESPTAPPGGTTEYNPTASPTAPPGGTTEYNPTASVTAITAPPKERSRK
ncbi:hypothetical protein NHX12_002811 [Muraenolepis orangiensis]|uniref:Uncharacterized protein n=1 Tax=Muraenolepis orangiensis TaxID=630683 RepID=A0A9Q0DV76_9TELE|nr:hypothetical protein NHX12_002811 [Muraenolepis orangiensis]